MTPLFLGIAALISLLSLALLLRPLLRRGGAQRSTSRLALNAAIYGDQLAELERDRASGSLAAGDFEQARTELQRRLLEDAQTVDVAPLPTRPAWQALLLLAVALPTAALVTYVWLGHPRAQEAALGHDESDAQVEQMVAALAARLEKNPEDIKGWGMLARSYKAMRRFDDAERAFGRLGAALYTDPTLLAEYADLLAVRADGSLEGKPLQLVQKALQLDPNHMMSLSLAGTAAYNRADYPAALNYWEHLYSLLPPDSEDARSLTATLAEIRAKAGVDAAAQTPAAKRAGSGKTVAGEVRLSPQLKDRVHGEEVLFVYARAASGARMPLAVLRARAADLPLKFRLDDTLAISPEAKISGADQVQIEARISKSGSANPGSGDLFGESKSVKVGASGLLLVIDKAAP